MRRPSRIAILLGALLLAWGAPQAHAAPKLDSVFPLGGQRGTVVDVELVGSGLEGAYAVWLGPGSRIEPAGSLPAAGADDSAVKHADGITARVTAVADGSHANAMLEISPEARLGFHLLSLVSPSGVSAAVPFWVGAPEVIQESAAAHDSPETAQPIETPGAVSGRLKQSGQSAFYAFEVAEEQSLTFEVVSLHGNNFDPQLALYRAGGSFLDPRRSKRLLFDEEISQGGMPASRRVTYRCTKASYLLQLSNIFLQAGDFSYLLRIAPADGPAAPDAALAWAKQRLDELASRGIAAPATPLGLTNEAEPNDQSETAQAGELPGLLEGTIGAAGDVDYFKFNAKAGQLIAIDVKTPKASAPYFNVRLDVIDAKGQVVLSNLQTQQAKIGTVDSKVIQFVPALAGTLTQEGEHRLRVRDLTSIHGSPDHAYWLLVRSQIPHVGNIQLQPDEPVNLTAGGSQRWTIAATNREGFTGSVAFSLEGLPQGVQAFVGAGGSVIEWRADTAAAGTPIPQVVRIWGLPIAEEKSGLPFLVKELPLMVVGGAAAPASR